MSYQTVVLSSLEEYLANTDETEAELAEQMAARDATLRAFPLSVILQVAYPEIDYANRWAWQQFGPRAGECFDVRPGLKPSEYPVCNDPEPHTHQGTWCCRWLVKTDYDFGFCEWYFSNLADKDSFLAFAPTINWGENFPKQGLQGRERFGPGNAGRVGFRVNRDLAASRIDDSPVCRRSGVVC